MDSLLGDLFGGESDNDARAKANDFVNRVESGDPTQGFSTEEALTSYSQVAGRLSPEELQAATTQALERFSPEQRREFSAMLQSKANGGGDVTDDPSQIAQLTSQLQSQSPDGLLGALGGGGGLDSILGGLLGGGQPSGNDGGGGGLLDNLLGGLFTRGGRHLSARFRLRFGLWLRCGTFRLTHRQQIVVSQTHHLLFGVIEGARRQARADLSAR